MACGINDWLGKARITVGSATAGLVVLGNIKKDAEQAMGCKPVKQHSSMVSVAVLALTFLDDWLWAIIWNKSFAFQVAFGHGVFITAKENEDMDLI